MTCWGWGVLSLTVVVLVGAPGCQTEDRRGSGLVLEKHQGPLAWNQLGPWNSLTKEPWCRNPILTEVINHIRAIWGRLGAVGVPHPHRRRGPDDAVRWVHGLIMFVFSNVEQGDRGVTMGVVEGPPRRKHDPCVRISLLMVQSDTTLFFQLDGDSVVVCASHFQQTAWSEFVIVFCRSRPVMSARSTVQLVSCVQCVMAVLQPYSV